MPKDFQNFAKQNNFDEFQTYIVLETYNALNSRYYDIEPALKRIEKEYDIASDKKFTDTESVLPTHYSNLKIEPVKFIFEQKLDFFAGNVIKYISRLGKKDSRKDELKKIHFYLGYIVYGNYEHSQKFKKDK